MKTYKPKKISMYEKQKIQPTIEDSTRHANRKFSMVPLDIDSMEEK